MNNYLDKWKASASIVFLLLIPISVYAAPDWYNEDWTYSKLLTFNASVINGTHANFPVLVNITDSDLVSNAASDGSDILFTLPNNVTKLDHEIEHFNSTNGWLLAWVKMPIGINNTNQVFMYYNDTGSNGLQNNTAAVWENYHLVLHMGDNLKDASGNNGYATNDGSTLTDGHIYKHRTFDGINDGIRVENSYLDLILEEGNNFSINSWVVFGSTGAGSDYMWNKGDWGSTYPDNQQIYYEIRNTNQDTRHCTRYGQPSTITLTCADTQNHGTDHYDKWHLEHLGTFDYDLDGELDRSEFSHIRNGTCISNHASTSVFGLNPCAISNQYQGGFINNTNDFTIGYSNDDTVPMVGALDEFRIAKSKLSYEWNDTEYKIILSSQKNQWITLGNQDTNPSPTYNTLNLKVADRLQNHIAYVTNTDTTTDLDLHNPSIEPVEVPIVGNVIFLDASFGVSGNGIVCLFDGRVKVTGQLHITNSGAQRSNDRLEVYHNGESTGITGATGYIRQGGTSHAESSLHVTSVFNCIEGGKITLVTTQEGAASITTMMVIGSSMMLVERI